MEKHDEGHCKTANNCKKCQLNKHKINTKEPMTITTTPIKPFDVVIIDTIGLMSLTFFNWYRFFRLCYYPNVAFSNIALLYLTGFVLNEDFFFILEIENVHHHYIYQEISMDEIWIDFEFTYNVNDRSFCTFYLAKLNIHGFKSFFRIILDIFCWPLMLPCFIRIPTGAFSNRRI